jgi:hypothetical protein
MARYAGQLGTVPAASADDMAPLAQANATPHNSAAALAPCFIPIPPQKNPLAR